MEFIPNSPSNESLIPIMEETLFQVEVQDQPHAVIVKCSGRIVHGEGADLLRNTAMPLAGAVPDQQRQDSLVIDLGQVEAIDACGLGVLVELHQSAIDGGTKLVIRNPSKIVRKLLETTGLNGVLPVVDYSSRAA